MEPERVARTPVRPARARVGGVLGENGSQMGFPEDDDVVEAFVSLYDATGE